MKIAILGASGKTGRVLVSQALQAGHSVSALVRDPARAGLDTRVRVVAGDVRSADAVLAVTTQSDAVISALGAPLSRTFSADGRVGTYGMPVVIAAMRQAQVRRLVAISAYFAGDGRAKLSSLGRLFVPTVMHGERADKDEMERLVRASELDWSIVRPTNLNDKPATGRVLEDPSGSVGMSSWIPRADVAAFILRILGDQKYFGRATLITC